MNKKNERNGLSKTVLITGSSNGLGKAIALAFASEGNSIILHGRNKKNLHKIEDHIFLNVSDIIVGDITDFNTIENLIKAVKKYDVNVFINNAGIYLKDSLSNTSIENIIKIVNTNFVFPMILTKGIFEIFKEKRCGTIININSIAGKIPTKGETIYCASKFGMNGFSNSLKYEATEYNIKIIDIYIGAMDTEISNKRSNNNKLIKPEEVANIILSLSGDYNTARISDIDILRNIY
jgi:short-subunit dehydrogenase